MISSPDQIFIVEDEGVSRRALASLLNSEGYQTEAFETAEETLDKLNNEQPGFSPNVILVDLNLPGMNGIELLEQLQKSSPGLHGVLITAARDEEIDRFCRENLVTYIRKPIDFSRLVALLGKLKRRDQPMRSKSIQ
jgi:two-component system, OmpR family, response regulator